MLIHFLLQLSKRKTEAKICLTHTHTSIKLLIYLKEGHENFSAWKWGHNLVTIMKYVRVISLILAEDETPKHIWQNLSFRC